MMKNGKSVIQESVPQNMINKNQKVDLDIVQL